MVLVGVQVTESQNATKKPHEMGKSAEKIGGFRHLKDKNYIFELFFVLACKSGFCSVLNEAAPDIIGVNFKLEFCQSSSFLPV